MNVYKINVPGDYLIDNIKENNLSVIVMDNKVHTDTYVRSSKDIREVKHFNEWYDGSPSADFDADFDYCPCSPSAIPDINNAVNDGYNIDLVSTSRIRILCLLARDKKSSPYYLTLTDYTILNRNNRERKLTTVEFTNPQLVYQPANTNIEDTVEEMAEILADYAKISRVSQINEAINDHYVAFKLATPSKKQELNKPTGLTF